MRVFHASAPVRRVRPSTSFNASGVTVDVSHNPLTGAAKTGVASVRVQPVILAGGTGPRLLTPAPQQFPKQLIELMGSESLLVTTRRPLQRLVAATPWHHPVHLSYTR